MPTPEWALWLSFWLHMLATVTWIGGLATLSLFVIPIAQRYLDSESYSTLLRNINKRLDPVGWFSLALLTATGLVQMGDNPNYEGLLTFGNDWSKAILFKHLVFFGMIAVSAYITWGITPAIQRAAIRRARGDKQHGESELQRREIHLIYLNLSLGVIVLVLTALARIS